MAAYLHPGAAKYYIRQPFKIGSINGYHGVCTYEIATSSLHNTPPWLKSRSFMCTQCWQQCAPKTDKNDTFQTARGGRQGSLTRTYDSTRATYRRRSVVLSLTARSAPRVDRGDWLLLEPHRLPTFLNFATCQHMRSLQALLRLIRPGTGTHTRHAWLPLYVEKKKISSLSTRRSV